MIKVHRTPTAPAIQSGGMAAVPLGRRVYAVGDVHGCADLLEPMLDAIAEDVARRPVETPIEVFIGDYIDRGLESAQVIDLLARPGPPGSRRVCLLGNHEAVLMTCMADGAALRSWRSMGAMETLQSYGIEPKVLRPGANAEEFRQAAMERIPLEHWTFLQSLLPFFSVGGLFFCHAGVRPGISLGQQSRRDLLWIRDEFLQSSMDFGRVVIHGHTPVRDVSFRANRINIDTGAYATGVLSCVILGAETTEVLTISKTAQ